MGLTGDSGLVYDDQGNLIGHFAMPYDAEIGDGQKYVFIDIELDGHPWWKRMLLSEVEEQGLQDKIIKCRVRGCKENAVTIDHYYPYYNDDNLCEKHWKKCR